MLFPLVRVAWSVFYAHGCKKDDMMYISVGLMHKSALVLVHTRVFSELELVLKVLHNILFNLFFCPQAEFSVEGNVKL